MVAEKYKDEYQIKQPFGSVTKLPYLKKEIIHKYKELNDIEFTRNLDLYWNKLEDDGNIKQSEDIDGNIGYMVTYKGMSLIENGGYTIVKEKEQRSLRRKNTIEILVAVSSIIAAIYSVLSFYSPKNPYSFSFLILLFGSGILIGILLSKLLQQILKVIKP
ncbi:hypothetical protein [Edaphocola flava]|uniref:hypothetical protein n=1 Tax=Edaphocola flava TaxID=2499629 RepID=UPI00100BA1B2|nr:hypothetical protein [Edaphocola flava]